MVTSENKRSNKQSLINGAIILSKNIELLMDI